MHWTFSPFNDCRPRSLCTVSKDCTLFSGEQAKEMLSLYIIAKAKVNRLRSQPLVCPALWFQLLDGMNVCRPTSCSMYVLVSCTWTLNFSFVSQLFIAWYKCTQLHNLSPHLACPHRLACFDSTYAHPSENRFSHVLLWYTLSVQKKSF